MLLCTKNRPGFYLDALILLLFSIPFSVAGQKDSIPAVSVSANLDLVSRYVWRGMDIGNTPNAQPDLSASWKGFTLGSWGSYNLSGKGGQETDFYCSKSIDFLTVSVFDYWNYGDSTASDFFDYNEKSTAHVLESQLLFSGGEWLPFNFLASYFFYGADTSKSIYLELQYNHSSKQGDLLIFAGYQASGNYYGDKKAFVNVGCTFTKSIPITDCFLLPLNLSLVVNPSAKSAYLVAGISL